MAEEIVGVKIKVDGTDMNKSIGDLKKSIAETEAEVKRLSDAYGASSKEAQDAQKRLAQLQDITNQKIEQQNQRIDNAAKTVSALSAAYGGVQGALELTGLAGEDTIKQLAKIQSALAIGDAVQNLAEFRGAITSTFSSMKSGAVKAFNAIKAGIGSTGIGVLLLALGAIVAYWDDIKEAVSGVSSEQKKLNEQSKENLKTQEEKLDAIDGQTNQLKLQGKSEKEILNIKIKQTDEAIKAAEINLANAKATRDAQVKAAERNKNIVQGLIAMVTSPITAVLAGIDLIGKAVGKNFGLAEGFTGGLAKMVFDPEQTAKDADVTIKEAENGLNKLKEKRAGFQLSVNNIDQQAATKAKDQATKNAADDKAERERIQKEIEDATKARYEREDAARKVQTDAFRATLDERKREELTLEDEYEAKRSTLIRAGIYDFAAIEEEKRLALLAIGDKYDKIAAEKKKKEEDDQKAKDEEALKIVQTNRDRELEYATKIADTIEERRIAELASLQEDYERKIALAKKNGEDTVYLEKLKAAAIVDINKKAAEEEKKTKKAKFDSELEMLSQTLSTVGGLIDQNSVAGKAIAVTQAIINTYQGASKAIAQGGIFGPVAAAATIAAGLVNVRKIMSTKVPSATGSGSVSGGGMPSMAMSSAPISPISPIQNTVTQLDQGTINRMGSAAGRAYVVESDITNQQEKIVRINRAARLG